MTGCGSPHWATDMWCDDENNNAECNWDGGACCFNDHTGWDNYCTVRHSLHFFSNMIAKSIIRKIVNFHVLKL